MAQYFTPAGLAALAPTESSGIPTAVNPSSGASGLYGFLDSTWRSFAPQAGVDLNQYPTAASAPASVQTAVAGITPISNWTCPGCNSLAASIAATPGNVTGTPGTNFTAPSNAPDWFDTSNPPGTPSSQLNPNPSQPPDPNADFTFNPSQPADPASATTIPDSQNPQNMVPTVDAFGNPVSAANPSSLLGPLGAILGTGGLAAPALTATGNTAGASGGDFFSNLAATAWNFAQRGGLIILAIVLIAVGAFWLAHHPDTQRAVKRVTG